MVHLSFSSFLLEIQESAHSFPAQRVVIEPTRRTAAVVSLRSVYPCSNYKSDRKFLSKRLRSRNRAPLLLCSIWHYEDAWRLMKGHISHEIERFLLKLYCSSQWQNLLRVNARTEGYWQVSLRSWRYCLGARLKFWRRSCDPKKGVGTRRLNFYISQLTPLVTALMSFGGSSEFKTFPSNKRHES